MTMPADLLDTVTTGDARLLTERIPDASIDLCFADPPYWVGYKYGNGRTDSHMDYLDPIWLVTELTRIAEVVCITPGIANIAHYPTPLWILGWFKPASVGRSALGGFNTWEPILVYGKPKSRFWQDSIYLPVTNQVEAAFHTCPKPLDLLRWIIAGMTQEGDIVLDPVCGSGTTVVAAKQLHRHYIGFEIDPDTAERARQRVANTQVPLPLEIPEQMEMLP